MRAHSVLPVAMVLIVVASGFVLIAAPAHAQPAVAHAAAPHPLATDSIQATNRYGNPRSDFAIGYSNGVVYFSAYDPSDSQATITLTDTNATRDHLATPVFSYTASFASSSYNWSWTYNYGFLLPLNLTYGGNWTLTISGATAGVYNTTIFVHTYSVWIDTTEFGYLPGHVGSGLFGVERTVNAAPYSNAAVKIFGEYYSATTGNWEALTTITPSSFTSASRGAFNFTVPLTADTSFGGLDFVIYANATPGLSESDSVGASVGNLSQPVIEIGTCPGGCHTNAFSDGATVYVQVFEYIQSYFSSNPAAGVTLTTTFASGTVPVTVPGVPQSITTNDSGEGAFVFIASSSVFSTQQIDELSITASDPTNAALPTAISHVFFTVEAVAPVTPQIEVQFQSLQYYGGDTATVSWQLGGTNSSVTQGWTVDQWFIYDISGSGRTLGWGTINSTQNQGQFTFAIPTNYGGTLEAWVSAYNATDWIENWADTSVTAPTILLNPSESYYLPGDTVTVQVTTEGSVFSGTTLYQSVVESSGYQIAAGVLSGTQIQFTVPKTGAPSYITVSVAAQSSTLGVVATSSIEVSLGSGYVLYAGIATESSYSDGSFQPGQTISVSYNLVTVGTATLPKTFNIYVYPGSTNYFGSGYGAIYTAANSPSGSVSYTIPSSMPAGAQTFTVVVTSGVCGYSCGAVTQFSAVVEPNPSVMGYELGAGSGVTVAWVILLVLVLLVAIVAYMGLRRAGRGGSKPSAVKPFAGSSGSPPPSSSGSTEAWKEGGSSSSPPPMPQPPKSS